MQRYVVSDVAGPDGLDASLVSPAGCDFPLPEGVTAFLVRSEDECGDEFQVFHAGQTLVLTAPTGASWTVTLHQDPIPETKFAPETFSGTGSGVGEPILVDQGASLGFTSEGVGNIAVRMLAVFEHQDTESYVPFRWFGSVPGQTYTYRRGTGTYLPVVVAESEDRDWELFVGS